MITRHEVWMNGKALRDINPLIVVQGVTEGAPTIERQTVSLWQGGSMVTVNRRRSMILEITFGIAERRNMFLRSQILNEVCAWAAEGGDMEVGYRPDQKIQVHCTSLPAMLDARQWNNSLGIRFEADEIPYWQDIMPRSVTGTTTASTAQTVALSPGGNTQTPLMATFANTGTDTCNTITLQSTEGTFALTNLGLTTGETLTMDQSSLGILRLYITATDGSTRTVLHKRTATSLDTMLVAPEGDTVTLQTDAPITYTLTTRGRWL